LQSSPGCSDESGNMTRAVRGAIQVRDNSLPSIEEASVRLVGEIVRRNAIARDLIVSIVLSLTDDLSAANPATALRHAGFAATPLFCVQEARVDGAMLRVIRALVTYETQEARVAVPVYLDGAESLRADLPHGDHS
jgi:chorismate mutase